MKNNKTQLRCLISSLFLLFSANYTYSCSMYKITLHGKTIVGCNEDAWRTTPHIWFETQTNNNRYGAGFTGSRFDGNNGYAPQSGMNEVGLSFSRLASHTPEGKTSTIKKGKNITNPTLFLKNILHSCKDVDEVNTFISSYDHSYFKEDVFIYIDQSGKYLIIEPYQTFFGNDSTYVLSNFCPSVTPYQKKIKLERYKNGFNLLNVKQDTSIEFCTAMSDTMHVCREKIGDGTLLSSIWNLKDKTINLYFYHNYSHVVNFNLNDELKKGNHELEITTLFPKNDEFEKLKNYQTTQNNTFIRPMLVIIACILILFSLFIIFKFVKKTALSTNTRIVLFIMIITNILLFIYLFVLCTNSYIFYFHAPYVDPQSKLISLTSYTPYLLLIIQLALIYATMLMLKKNIWTSALKTIILSNQVIYILLIFLFYYWYLY